MQIMADILKIKEDDATVVRSIILFVIFSMADSSSYLPCFWKQHSVIDDVVGAGAMHVICYQLICIVTVKGKIASHCIQIMTI